MMIRSLQSHLEKVANAFFLSNQKHKAEWFCLSLLILFLPLQLGKHFWPEFASVSGLRIDYLSPTLYITDILILILFVSWFLRVKKGKLLSTLFKKKFIFLCLCFFVLNVYFSQFLWNSIYSFIKLLEYVFLFLYISQVVRTSQQVFWLFSLLSIGVIFESLLAIAQFFNKGSLNGFFYFLGERFFTAQTPGIANASVNGELILRAYATFPHPNVLAGFLIIVMSFLLFNYQSQKNKMVKKLWVFSLSLGTVTLALTMSRIAILLWVLILIIGGLRWIIKQKLKLIFSTIFILGLVSLFVFTPIGARLLQTSLNEEALTHRTDLIAASANVFIQYPLIGVGLGGFIPAMDATGDSFSLHFPLQPVHNIFLLLLVETGLVGLGVFIIFLQRTFTFLFVHRPQRGVSLIWVLLLGEILVLGSVDHYFLTLQQGQLLFTVVLALSWTNLHR